MNYRVSASMLHYLEKVSGLSGTMSRSSTFDRFQSDESWMQVIGWDAVKIGLGKGD